MIRKSFLALLLLVPCLAYGGNPSTDLTVQIPSSGNGGGGGSLTPPPEAAKAGFTTLAANYDFSQSQYATLSNWFSANPNGNTAGIQWVAGWPGGVWGGPINNAIFQTTDSAGGAPGKVLDIRWLSSYDRQYGCNGASNSCYVSMQTATNGSVAPYTTIFSFPNAYIEVVDRLDTTVSTGGNTVGPSGVWTESALPAGGCCEEIDIAELYGSSNGFGDAGSKNSGFAWLSYANNNLPAGWTPTAYHKYGILLTSNGSNSAPACFFVDDVFQYSNQGGCNNETPLVGNRSYLIAWNGALGADATTAPTVNEYIQYIRVWSCATWATGQCNGTTLTTGANNLQYWH